MNPWTDEENRAIVALYFEMLDCALCGVAYNKAAMIREAQQHESDDGGPSYPGSLVNRSKGSIEAKLMNCTAAHESLCPNDESMAEHGYRPLTRYQASLRVAVAAELADREFVADCASLVAS